MRYQVGPCILALFLSRLALSGQQATTAPAPPPGMKSYFVILLTTEGDAKRLVTSPEWKALFGEHREFIREKLAARKYLLAGPVTDASPLGALAIVAARDEAQAREWEDGDPLVKAGKFRYEVHPVLLQSLDVLKYDAPN